MSGPVVRVVRRVLGSTQNGTFGPDVRPRGQG
jgi:hypothetical protein